MLDIESGKFSIKSDGTGWATVRSKRSPRHCASVPMSDVPSAYDLAMMPESKFDSTMRDLLGGN